MGSGRVVVGVGAEFTVEAEIGVVEEDAGVEEPRAADGELVEDRPSATAAAGGERKNLAGDGGEGGEAL